MNFAFCILAQSAGAAPRQVRAPAEVERLYNQLGSTMTCTCGCREVLLDCSHNNCPTKPVEQRFLRELCEDATLDVAAIRAGMATRFGDKILQAPTSSLLYPLLAAGGLLVVGVFSALVWMVRRGKPPQVDVPAATPRPDDPSLDARIEREIKEIDEI